MDSPSSVLLVGSVPLSSASEVFTEVSQALQGRLQSIPDGETGDRYNYIRWQLDCFPRETLQFHIGGTEPTRPNPEYTIESVQPTRYDEVAISSYDEFVRLRTQNAIPSNVRFQVCLPPPFNTLQLVRPEFRVQLEPLYEHRLRESLDRIIDTIPAGDLVIQWDMCFEIMALEFDRDMEKHPRFKAHFSPVKEGILDRIARQCDVIPPDVRIAFHLCYGDYEHRHYMEPVDTELLVEFANNLVERFGDRHPVEWIHMPVPKGRVDVAYFLPLEQLKLPARTRLYLGLVHAHDEGGTRKRIQAARSVYRQGFGVATECGLGRTPKEDFDSIFRICSAVTVPKHTLPA